MMGFWVKVSALLVAVTMVLIGAAIAFGHRQNSMILAFTRDTASYSELHQQNVYHSQVHVQDIHHGLIVQITREQGDHINLVWSPDGTQIAFLEQYAGAARVFLVNEHGYSLRAIEPAFADVRGLFWSPDGTHLIISAVELTMTTDPFVNNNLYLADVSSLEIHALTDDTATKEAISWSPNGRYFLYTENYDIAVVDMTSNEIIHWSSNGFNPFGQPQWSHDGNHLVLTDGIWEIAMVNPQGETVRHLTNSPSWEMQPMWSGDGSGVYFIEPYEDSIYAAAGDLVWIDVETVSQHHVASNVSLIAPLTLSANDDHILYSEYIEGFSQPNSARIINQQGLLVARFEHIGYLTSIQWSPDGRYLVYTIWSDNFGELPILFILDIQTRQTRNLGSINYGGYSWRP